MDSSDDVRSGVIWEGRESKVAWETFLELRYGYVVVGLRNYTQC